MRTRAFSPSGQTASITVGAASGRVLVCNRNGAQSVRIVNAGTATVWIEAGGSAVTAAVTDLPILAGTVEVLTFNPGDNGALYIAAIAAGATGVIYFTPGDGV
jgi:hypothetical protein